MYYHLLFVDFLLFMDFLLFVRPNPETLPVSDGVVAVALPELVPVIPCIVPES